MFKPTKDDWLARHALAGVHPAIMGVSAKFGLPQYSKYYRLHANGKKFCCRISAAGYPSGLSPYGAMLWRCMVSFHNPSPGLRLFHGNRLFGFERIPSRDNVQQGPGLGCHAVLRRQSPATAPHVFGCIAGRSVHFSHPRRLGPYSPPWSSHEWGHSHLSEWLAHYDSPLWYMVVEFSMLLLAPFLFSYTSANAG